MHETIFRMWVGCMWPIQLMRFQAKVSRTRREVIPHEAVFGLHLLLGMLPSGFLQTRTFGEHIAGVKCSSANGGANQCVDSWLIQVHRY